MIRTVILDFDGTIGDTCGLIVRTMRQTLAELGLPPHADGECAATIGLPLRQCFVKLLGCDGPEAARCENKYRELFARNNAEYRVAVFPHVVETMRRLHGEGYTLAIASSRSRRSLLDFLADMRLADVVRCVVASTDVEHAKPAPDMALRALGETGGSAAEAIMVGDTWFDIEMGRRAGTLTCGVTYGNGSRRNLAAADFLIDDFADLAAVVNGQVK